MDTPNQDPNPGKDDIPKKNDDPDSVSDDHNTDGKTKPDSESNNFIHSGAANTVNQAAGDIHNHNHYHYHGKSDNEYLDENLEKDKRRRKDKEDRNRDQQNKVQNVGKTKSPLSSAKYLPNDGVVWFRKQSLKTQAFIITLLFFPDSSLQFLDEISGEIVGLLNKGKVARSEQSISIFDQDFSIQSLIDDGIVNILKSRIDTDAGVVVVDVVSTADFKIYDRLSQLILTNYDFVRIHPLIKSWLIKQVEKNNQALYSMGAFDADLVKMQAALGLGMLARYDFSSILSSIIIPWAGAEDPSFRLLVGWVFLGYYQEETSKEYWNTVTSLLNHWVSLDNYFLRWTAIASTTKLGMIYSPEDDTSLNVSLSIYKDVSKSNQAKNFKGVLNKCIRFLFSLSPYHARTICNDLRVWLKDDSNIDINIADIAAELFIEVVNVKITPESSEENKKGLSIWELCETESYVLSDSVFLLIRQALLHPKGRFVDRAVEKISQSLDEFLKNETVSHTALGNILRQINTDKSLSKHLPLILGDNRTGYLISL